MYVLTVYSWKQKQQTWPVPPCYLFMVSFYAGLQRVAPGCNGGRGRYSLWDSGIVRVTDGHRNGRAGVRRVRIPHEYIVVYR